MNQSAILLSLSLLFSLVSFSKAGEEIKVESPLAFQDRFQEISKDLGFPKGNVLHVGCIIKPAGHPIKQVTFKNIASGIILTASPEISGKQTTGVYIVDPKPVFNPSKHMGIWEINVSDEKGNKAIANTHRLNNYGQMPYVREIKASGNPLAPMLSWSAPKVDEIPKNCSIKYEVSLLLNKQNKHDQILKSAGISTTKYQIPQGLLTSKDISKVFIRIDTLGYDDTDVVHTLPLEFKSHAFLSLEDALKNQ